MQQSLNMDDDPFKKAIPENLASPVEPPILATPENMPKVGELVAHPRIIDVVGTRRRNWQNHPGNQYYREQVNKYRDLLMAPDNKKTLRTLASELVQIILQRGAVFLRADEQEGGWYVMDENACIHKATLAMKNAEIKKRGASLTSLSSEPGDGGPKKKKKSTPASLQQPAPPKQTPRPSKPKQSPPPTSNESVGQRQDLPPIDYMEGTPPERETHRRYFDIIEGNVSVSQYTKDIILLMCNQTNASKAATVLDEPLVLAEEESDKQRLLRLQLRQRYIAALTIGMSPINFSLKLMELWGGSLVEKRVPIERPKPKPVPSTQSEVVTQAGDEVKVVDGKSAVIEVEKDSGTEGRKEDFCDSVHENVLVDFGGGEKEASNEVGNVAKEPHGSVKEQENKFENSGRHEDVGGVNEGVQKDLQAKNGTDTIQDMSLAKTEGTNVQRSSTSETTGPLQVS